MEPYGVSELPITPIPLAKLKRRAHSTTSK